MRRHGDHLPVPGAAIPAPKRRRGTPGDGDRRRSARRRGDTGIISRHHQNASDETGDQRPAGQRLLRRPCTAVHARWGPACLETHGTGGTRRAAPYAAAPAITGWGPAGAAGDAQRNPTGIRRRLDPLAGGHRHKNASEDPSRYKDQRDKESNQTNGGGNEIGETVSNISGTASLQRRDQCYHPTSEATTPAARSKSNKSG